MNKIYISFPESIGKFYPILTTCEHKNENLYVCINGYKYRLKSLFKSDIDNEMKVVYDLYLLNESNTIQLYIPVAYICTDEEKLKHYTKQNLIEYKKRLERRIEQERKLIVDINEFIEL